MKSIKDLEIHVKKLSKEMFQDYCIKSSFKITDADSEIYNQYMMLEIFRKYYDITINIYKTWAMENSYNCHIQIGNDFDNIIQQECKKDRSFKESLDDAFMKYFELIKENGK